MKTRQEILEEDYARQMEKRADEYGEAWVKANITNELILDAVNMVPAELFAQRETTPADIAESKPMLLYVAQKSRRNSKRKKQKKKRTKSRS